MARIAIVIDIEKNGDVKCDLGGKDIVTAERFQQAGVDAPPMADDAIHVTEGAGAGQYLHAGTDDDTARTAKPGEYRVYSRDADKVVVAEVHLKQDGTIEAKNGAASITVTPAGDVSIVPKDGQTLTLGGGSDAPSLASKTKAALDKIVDALNNAVPGSMDGGALLLTNIQTGLTGIDTDVASALVKTD